MPAPRLPYACPGYVLTWHAGWAKWNTLHERRILPRVWRGVRVGRRSSPAKRVYGLKPVSRVQISPSPPGIKWKRRVTVKGSSPFLRVEARTLRGSMRGIHTVYNYFAARIWRQILASISDLKCSSHAKWPESASRPGIFEAPLRQQESKLRSCLYTVQDQ